MTDTATHLSLDNYADLLALAEVVRATARCSACGADSAPVRTDALWVLHDRTDASLSAPRLLCARHAAQWSRTGIHPSWR
ncbi:hypothetical protein [Demequina mangrovi]|uniref:Uncharacterized protein n=1 Tax=Demequina mangrovi TaxID=1043493 RepID=A0A1H6ZEY9_9MICO|nr:hypothetical protein [Demequina mangrovi]SEJ52133.1 hypothetical protein SAMN05421637_2125 [Demequina mangrovi]